MNEVDNEKLEAFVQAWIEIDEGHDESKNFDYWCQHPERPYAAAAVRSTYLLATYHCRACLIGAGASLAADTTLTLRGHDDVGLSGAEALAAIRMLIKLSPDKGRLPEVNPVNFSDGLVFDLPRPILTI